MSEFLKAETLGDILMAFRTEPLNKSEFVKFYYDKTMPIRTGDESTSPLYDLYDECSLNLPKNAHLLMGHGGSGKSTELYNLKQRFEENGQPTCIIDFMAYTDFINADHWDMMLLISEGLCEIAKEHNLYVPEKTLNAVIDYLKDDVETKIDTGISSEAGVEAGVSANTPKIFSVLNVFASIRSEIKASTYTRTNITRKMERHASEWLRFINEISDWVMKDLSGKQPVLIFENIDKFQPPIRALEILLYQYLSEMPFPVIYTFPISLCYNPRFAIIEGNYKPHMLPMIKTSNVDKSHSPEGINAIREIVKLRANESLFCENALDNLITQTGGVLRDLFECIISAARRADRRGSSKIEMEDAARALADLGERRSRLISMHDNDKLVNIYNDPRYREQIEDLDFLLEKMQGLVVLEYRNGYRWHNLHPMIAQYLKGQGVIK